MKFVIAMNLAGIVHLLQTVNVPKLTHPLEMTVLAEILGMMKLVFFNDKNHYLKCSLIAFLRYLNENDFRWRTF